MTKTIKLYHGTTTFYEKVDLGSLYGFSEGVGIYMTESPSYAITYTSMRTTNNYTIAITLGNTNKPHRDSINSIHEVDVPINMISDIDEKRIPLIDFYKLAKDINVDTSKLKEINFNYSDFDNFSEIVLKVHGQGNPNILKKAFKFMVDHDYHVIKVPQPTRNMVKCFYLMLDEDMFNNGKVYKINEI